MTALTHLPIARPRLAGQRRPAASWRAPVGAGGTGARPSVGFAGMKRGARMGRPSDRKQQTIEVTGTRACGFGYRSLDAEYSGAGSEYWEDAP